ncbi:hypothetical protein [Erythrobacter rubeus]|uniref:Uncharacterized protein n=1 Tax=Erythrobacter rubeus TaxID=2760803 RepID=A0ABR8KTR4_9SPHN|nr:hypothetical protein [Erythrobacter rubeus]MBD2841631.1 hypothetical protein [Erythrobacter rubeus]
MELFVPFMLFILGISDEDPAQVELVRHPALYADEADCLEAGEQIIRARVTQEHESSITFHMFCKPMPDVEEFNRLTDQLEENQRKLREERSQ